MPSIKTHWCQWCGAVFDESKDRAEELPKRLLWCAPQCYVGRDSCEPLVGEDICGACRRHVTSLVRQLVPSIAYSIKRKFWARHGNPETGPTIVPERPKEKEEDDE